MSVGEHPAVEGLRFRPYAGEGDHAAFVRIREAVRAVDGEVGVLLGSDIKADAPPEQDPQRLCIVAEVDGAIVGHSWITWWTETDGVRLYLHLGWIDPAWRGRGIGRALLELQEQRIRELAEEHGGEGRPFFGGNADDTQVSNAALLRRAGYFVAFTLVTFQRSLETPLPDAPLHAGYELRPVTEEQLPLMHQFIDGIFRSDEGTGYEGGSYAEFLEEYVPEGTRLDLWVTAWSGDELAAIVTNAVDGTRGETPWVAVAPAHRRKGLASALLAESMRRMRAAGATEARLNTLLENPHSSVALYESVGYTIVKCRPRYRKAL